MPEYTLREPPTSTFLGLYPVKKLKIKESGKDFERQQAALKQTFILDVPEGPVERMNKPRAGEAVYKQRTDEPLFEITN